MYALLLVMAVGSEPMIHVHQVRPDTKNGDPQLRFIFSEPQRLLREANPNDNVPVALIPYGDPLPPPRQHQYFPLAEIVSRPERSVDTEFDGRLMQHDDVAIQQF
jgi:hypothetical protein